MAVPRASLSCPRCGGTMETGYIVDEGYRSSRSVPKWSPGEPVKSFWTGLKVRKSDQRQVTTYRCRRCGYLENYA